MTVPAIGTLLNESYDPSFLPITSYMIFVNYVWDFGLRGVPMAGPPGTPLQIVTEHAVVCAKTIRWAVQAQDDIDASLVAPHWDTQNPNEILTGKALSAPFKMDIGDGTRLSTIAGEYSYLLLVPPSNTDPLAIAFPSWDISLQQIIMPVSFIQGLLNSSLTNPNPTGGYGNLPGSNVPFPIQKPPSGAQDLTGFTAIGGQ